MQYFFTKDGKTVTALLGFQVELGAVDVITGRKHSDKFRLQTSRPLDTEGGFVVLDETAKMFDCDASTVSVSDAPTVIQIAGVITKKLEAPKKEEALAAIKAAMNQQEKEK